MVTILTACIPTLRPLYMALFHGATRGQDGQYENSAESGTSQTYSQKHFKFSGTSTETGSQKSDIKLGPYANYAKTDVVGGHHGEESATSVLEYGDQKEMGIRRDQTVTVVFDG